MISTARRSPARCGGLIHQKRKKRGRFIVYDFVAEVWRRNFFFIYLFFLFLDNFCQYSFVFVFISVTLIHPVMVTEFLPNVHPSRVLMTEIFFSERFFVQWINFVFLKEKEEKKLQL